MMREADSHRGERRIDTRKWIGILLDIGYVWNTDDTAELAYPSEEGLSARYDPETDDLEFSPGLTELLTAIAKAMPDPYAYN